MNLSGAYISVYLWYRWLVFGSILVETAERNDRLTATAVITAAIDVSYIAAATVRHLPIMLAISLDQRQLTDINESTIQYSQWGEYDNSHQVCTIVQASSYVKFFIYWRACFLLRFRIVPRLRYCIFPRGVQPHTQTIGNKSIANRWRDHTQSQPDPNFTPVRVLLPGQCFVFHIEEQMNKIRIQKQLYT